MKEGALRKKALQAFWLGLTRFKGFGFRVEGLGFRVKFTVYELSGFVGLRFQLVGGLF